jgi:4-hydroxy-tetrahydrodipicolinate synthase
MTKPAPLPGIWPAMLTPLNEALDIDHRRFAAHGKALVEAGCGGLTPFGTTGEGTAFSVDERRAAVEALVAGGVPASRILVSTSCAALTDTLALSKHAVEIGAWGCLMLPPFYMKGVPDEGIVDAYRYVIDRVADTRLKVMLYHIPQVAGVGLSTAVVRRLASLYPDTIVGIKDSQCDLAHSLALADAVMPGLTVHVGNEADLPALGRRGSTGAVSGLANFMPKLVHRLVTRPDAPNTANELARVAALMQAISGYTLIPALKGIMALLAGDEAWLRVRPPLVGLSPGQLPTLRNELATLKLGAADD